MKRLVYYAAAFAASVLFVWWLGSLWRVPLRVPVYFSADTLLHWMFVQPLLEGEFPWHITRLGAPFFHNAYLFPQQSNIDYGLAAALGAAAGSVGAGLNLGWAVKTGVAAVLAAWSFRNLRVSPAVSLAAGILYSLLPYTFVRNVWHYNLSLYFVPVMASMALLALQGRFGAMPRGVRRTYYVMCFMVGLNGVYTAYFSCVLFTIVVLMALLARQWKRAAAPALGVALVSVAALASMAPAIAAFRENPVSAAIYGSDREQQTQVPIYSLKLCDLVLPTSFHPIPALAETRRLVTERNAFGAMHYLEHSALGLFGAAGFIVLLLALMRLPKAGEDAETVLSELRLPAVIASVLILIAITYGFSSIVATFVFSSIRSYDRLITFIGFFAFLATCRGLDRLHDRLHLDATPRRRLAWGAALCLLVPLGAVDQHGDGPLFILPKSVEKIDLPTAAMMSVPAYEEAETLVADVEKRLPEKAMVYQLGSPGGYEFDRLIPYAVGKTIHWSYVPHYPIDPLLLWREWFEDRLDEDPAWLLLAGFDGAWFDRREQDEAWLEAHLANLAALPGAETLESPRKRYVFVDLRNARKKLVETMGEEAYSAAHKATLQRQIPAPFLSARDAFGLILTPVVPAAPGMPE